MSKKLRYMILEEQSLILEYYSGQFCVDELIDFKKRIGKDKKFNPNFNVLSDIRELVFLFNPEEVKKYIQFLLENKKHIGIRKTAMITCTPNQVATSLGFDMLKDDLPVEFKIFSTFKSAFDFIRISAEERKELQTLFKKLKMHLNNP